MSDTVKYFTDSEGNLQALLVMKEHTGQKIEFLTEDKYYQQVAYMKHEAGHEIVPHIHNKIPRIVEYTCETLVIKKGKLEVTLYEGQNATNVFVISEGDVLSLFFGGHGFKILEEVEMIEIKQGPFLGANDKTRF